ncbi:AMP-binding protein [Streptomyces sp. NPDC048172]|uniref:AMP-binding protein n=1 Tax=Streptomyces sp. NPDC048172 TaxID=3365505 RepID=UPI0037240030
MRGAWVTDIVESYEHDDRPAHEYLRENGDWVRVSRHELLCGVRSAARGWSEAGMRPGDRVVLEAAEPHLFVPAFLGALWAGVVPVPVAPPPPPGRRPAWNAYVEVLADIARPRAVALRGGGGDAGTPAGDGWTDKWDPVDLDAVVTAPPDGSPDAPSDALPDAPPPYRPGTEETAYLQFSSGSTGIPRGVPARVEAVLANSLAIMRDGLDSDPATDRGLSWLPLHHDMGLVGFVLAPLIAGVPVSFVPTRSFVRDPGLWLRTMSERRATISFAPNFAYALTARRTSEAEAAALDLGHVRVLGCGAEPINPAVLDRFTTAFAASGLRPEALMPCYGLAEATLAVTLSPLGQRHRVDSVDPAALSAGRAAPSGDGDGEAGDGEALAVVSCGPPLPGHEVTVRDTEGTAVAERAVGEIWLRGPSNARTYMGSPDEARRAFGADGWLRSGDLGYLADGELFVTGRVKDLLILNGRNVDPQRVEWLAETVPGVRAGGVVACTRPGEQSEELVVVAECRTSATAGLAPALREAVAGALALPVHDVVAVRPGTVPRTTSGKPRRSETRRQYLEGALHVQQG